MEARAGLIHCQHLMRTMYAFHTRRPAQSMASHNGMQPRQTLRNRPPKQDRQRNIMDPKDNLNNMAASSCSPI
jgi:hypothetical protein